MDLFATCSLSLHRGSRALPPRYPWVFSCGDDCTIKIWNWQSRSLVSTVFGHGHWVMSVSPHPAKDLLMSVSLDGTCRLWDFSTLRHKTCHRVVEGQHRPVETLIGEIDVMPQTIVEVRFGDDGGLDGYFYFLLLP